MQFEDMLQFNLKAILGFRLRSLLLLLAMAIGVASVVTLISLGEGARRYVLESFSALGSNLIIVLPGRSETSGGAPPLLGVTPRDLTIDDAMALAKSPNIRHISPVSIGSAPVSWQQRERDVTILGSNHWFYTIRQLKLGGGRFLPDRDPNHGDAVSVIGSQIKKELFGSGEAVGRWIRINDSRFRVIGVLEKKGQSIGVDFKDVVIIPVASAQQLFNSFSLFRILVQAKSREVVPAAMEEIKQIIRDRHDGEDDVTVVTQDSLLSAFDRILKALTLTVSGIAAISLAVAGILIMNVMLVSVTQRTSEIGLLKALGASCRKITMIFLVETALVSLMGAAAGIALAFGVIQILENAFGGFTLSVPAWALFSAVAVGVGTGVLFGMMPARRAAKLDAVEALSGR